MANRCYCGRSEAYPWCDGSHARIAPDDDAAASEPPAATDGAEPASSRRPAGFLARLFGFKGPKA